MSWQRLADSADDARMVQSGVLWGEQCRGWHRAPRLGKAGAFVQYMTTSGWDSKR